MASDELGLPKSSLQKAIRDLLPPNMKVAGDASDLLVQCCNQFVHLVSTQANEVSEREKRSTISPEHVVKALEELEFGEQYVEAVKAAWDEWKVDNKEHRDQKLVHKKSGLGQASGLTQQQLIELQQKLFEEARAATLSGPIPSLASGPLPGLAAEPSAPAAVAAAAAEPAGGAAGPPQQQQQQQQQPGPGEQQQQQQPVAAAVAAAAEAPRAAAAGGPAAGGDDELADVDVDSELEDA